jgi:hypothetical protein
MENDPMQFLIVRQPELTGIVLYPIYTDIQFSLDGRFRKGGKIKGDDVGIIIVLKVRSVDGEEVIITAKNNIE